MKKWIILQLMIVLMINFGTSPAEADRKPPLQVESNDSILLGANAPSPDTRSTIPISSTSNQPEPKLKIKSTVPSPKMNFYSAMLGASYWPALNDITPGTSVPDPNRFGEFRSWGFNMELSYHRLIKKYMGNDLRAGVDLGLFFHQNEKHFDTTILPSGKTIREDLNSRGFYLTPSLRWIMGLPGSPRFYLGTGAGFYLVDFVEQLADGLEVDEYYEESALGGYLAGGLNIPLIRSHPEKLALCLEFKMHFINFGDLESFAPGAGDLKGPIYTFQVGLILP